jgi:drug/metabolite transporter (DMT)-like permease
MPAKVFITGGAVFTMVLWAICFPLISLSLPYAPIMLTAFLRAAIAGFFLIVIAWMLGRPFPKSTKVYLYILGIGVLVNKTGHINLLISRNLPAINHRS